jgi:iduronate 2-sulfatase
MNKDIRKIFLGLPLAILSFTAVADRSDGRPHVLFIAIDDLRPELGCYGSPIAKSPNLDKLAVEGMRFDRAYFRELNPEIVTLPQHFIKHGYEAVYCGKIYHGRMTDADHSWSRKPAFNRCSVKMKWLPGNYALKANQELWASNKEKMLVQYGKAGSGGLIHGPAYESADVPDHVYPDGYSTRLAIATLKDHREKKPNQPLFLALGFKKPHLDFIAPKKYWDLYDRDKIQLAKQTSGTKRGAATGLHASFELRTRHGIPKKGSIGPELAKTLLHGYYACVSYVDAQIGMMLEALEEAGIRDDTVIVVWGGQSAFCRNAPNFFRTFDSGSGKENHQAAREIMGPRSIREPPHGIFPALGPSPVGRLAGLSRY